MLRILVLSFYYAPDLSACSFRSTALVKALLDRLPANVHLEVITTQPNRYDSFTEQAPTLENLPRLTIHRIKLPPHRSGMLQQARAFITYARETMSRVKRGRYDLVYGTSSRLLTAALSAHVSRKQGAPLYLDIRDIFVDTIKDILPDALARFAKSLFSVVERWTIRGADSVNLVSPGFESYFSRRYPCKRYTYFTNGIDDEFIRARDEWAPVSRGDDRPVTVLYAGNIGDGQGLHLILPELAVRLEGRVRFRVVGDGGRRSRLEEAIAEIRCTNVHMVRPMNREGLIKSYRQADVLFLHLNDYPAFRKVLPSKVFEYAATGKPVWAGVAGYARDFVNAEIENAAVFPPCDVDEAVRTFAELTFETVPRTTFVKKYARTNIMKEMAADIGQFLPTAAT